jgi:hypothetical protein
MLDRFIERLTTAVYVLLTIVGGYLTWHALSLEDYALAVGGLLAAIIGVTATFRLIDY